MSYDLPNPFMFAAPVIDASQHAERVPSSDAALAGAAPGYQCCHDCGAREPCDEHCPVAKRAEQQNPTFAAENQQPRFHLDAAAMLSEIEPVPAFLTRDDRAAQIEELLKIALAEDWPAPPRRMVG